MVLTRRGTSLLMTFLFMGLFMALSPCGVYGGESLVVSGDQAKVHFTCRLKNGELAASSYEKSADDLVQRKSAIFRQRRSNDALAILAGKAVASGELKGFEEEIINLLSPAIVGLAVGKKETRDLRAEDLKEEKKGEYIVKVARVRKRAKQAVFTPEEYRRQTGKAPEVGQPYVIDPAVPGKVASVSDKEVVIRFSAIPGSKAPTPFGEGTVRELPDRFEIAIDARPGTLLRSGGFVGRVTEVTEEMITTDYCNPFGKEALLCDILVESIEPAVK